jgi:glucose-1-phosphate cytidylyltransferase
MKAVLLAGGLGTRISEETVLRPKPMIEIGGKPILWHIMKLYAHHGISDFIVCLGYKGYMIKEYFANFVLHNSDLTIDAKRNEITYHSSSAEPWRVTMVDTGEHSGTGGRLRRIESYLAAEDAFCMTYGDGLANVDISALIRHHRASGLKATVTAVVPPGRYGALELDGDLVKRFTEKPPGDGTFINGGFFVLSPDVLARIPGDDTAFEGEPLDGLTRDRQLSAFRHKGFWQPMDTLRDRNHLQSLWESGHAPWKIWD